MAEPSDQSPIPPPGSPNRRWWWRLETFAGAHLEVDSEYAGFGFPSQADAETWIGEFWNELAVRGVEAVTLLEGEREVYGPMSLSA